MTATGPSLTVILLTPDRFETMRTTVRHLAAQTALDRLELLFLVPDAQGFAPDPVALAPFPRVKVVEVGTMGATGPARARGVREASAPFVVFGEDHCYPEPEWAAALLRAFEEPWAAVGPVVTNANPVSMVSWADLLMGYGAWLAPGREGAMSHLPGHNCAYRREVLLSLDDRLDHLFDAETVLHWTLTGLGHRLKLEPRARVAHTNFAHWRTWAPVTAHHARVFAATRSEHWGVLTRAAWTAASPLIPAVRFLRIWRDARRTGVPLPLLVRALPALAGGLVVDGLGQMAGYATGAGGSRDLLAGFEFKRVEVNAKG